MSRKLPERSPVRKSLRHQFHGKEVKTMKYAKPEIRFVNLAITAIQGHGKSGTTIDTMQTPVTVPAYEADE